jgi:hypothetical protein
MVTPEYYTGDTWPPLTGAATDADGAALDLSSADGLRMIAKAASGATVIEGAAANLTDGTDGKWSYTWAADDLSVAGSYCPELEITWDESSSPPKIETCRDDAVTFLVKADND